jgi:hypothetical protein
MRRDTRDRHARALLETSFELVGRAHNNEEFIDSHWKGGLPCPGRLPTNLFHLDAMSLSRNDLNVAMLAAGPVPVFWAWCESD